MEAEWRLVAQVAKKWWKKAGIDLSGAQEAAKEEYGRKVGTEDDKKRNN